MCKQFNSWEEMNYSEAFLFWKNINNLEAEFDLTELSSFRSNTNFLQTLKNLLTFPQWTERIEQLEIIKEIFQFQRDGNNLISKPNNDVLALGQVNQFVENLERNLYKIDQNCWNLIKELSIAEDFLSFLKRISEKDVKNLIDDYSNEKSIQEDIILSLIHVKQYITPLISNHQIKNVVDFLEELQLIVKKDSTLMSKFALCNMDNIMLQKIYYSTLNHEQTIIEEIKNATLNGIYTFVFDEKNDKRLMKLKYPSLTKDMYQNEILDLREKALLIVKSNTTVNINDFIELVDVAQNIMNSITLLIQRGHFHYRKFEKEIKGMEAMKEFLLFLNDDLEKWSILFYFYFYFSIF